MDVAHMDIGSRNARLYEHLKAMGLYVIPVFANGDQSQIDYFHVAAGRPAYLAEDSAEKAARATVATPVPSAKIVQLVRPEEA